ncbi:MAG: LysR family transcriptional regulator [Solirubrobacteraceae bacterium]
MDPRRVLTFRTVAHQRSFSRAARDLALSQPSVSNQVAQLEREIGCRLLERGPGGVRLTGEGEILLEHADAIAERFRLAESQLASAAEGIRTRLRIGALPTALAGFVPAAIARLRLQHPDTRVTFDEGTSEELSLRVASGELDLAVGYEDPGAARHDPLGTKRHQLLHEQFMVALAPDHPLAREPLVRLADLSHEDWTAALTDGLIVRACRSAGFEPNLVSITRDQLAIRALIMRGLAVTLVPELLADPFTGLALRPIADVRIERDVYALLPPGGRHPLLAPTLDALDAVAAELQARRHRSPRLEA